MTNFNFRKPEGQKHAQPVQCSYKIINKQDLPKYDRSKATVYVIYLEINGVMEPIGVGETVNMRNRINHYQSCIRTLKPDGSSIIKWMQDEAQRRDNKLYFEAEFVIEVDNIIDPETGITKRRLAEAQVVQALRDGGCKYLKNRTKGRAYV